MIICILCMAFLLLTDGAGKTSAQQRHPMFSLPAQDIPRLPETRIDTLVICIMGDMMMHQAQIADAAGKDGTYDFSSYFRYLEKDIQSADIAIANMEFTLGGTPYSGYPCFSAPDSYASYLKECGFDIFLTANNHIYDKGKEGAERTLEIYDRLGILHTGMAGDSRSHDLTTPLKINAKGIRLALINRTYGTNLGISSYWPRVNYLNNREVIDKAFAEAVNCDVVMALPHWGEEYKLIHSAAQKEAAERMVRNGADIIIGTHPHVIQDMQYIDEVPVIYSLGNAVSNMSAANTQLELMVTLRITTDSMREIRILQPEFTFLWCSRPGGYCSSYAVLPVAEFIGTRDLWQGTWEYDKMVDTYERVKAITGIKEYINE